MTIVSDLGQHPRTELDAETGEAEDDLSVRVLRERLLNCMFQIVSGLGGSFQLEQESKHLRAERIFDEPRLMSPVSSKNVAESLNFCFDPPADGRPV